MTKQLLFMGRPPDVDDKEALLEWVAMVSRRITGREPTPEEIYESVIQARAVLDFDDGGLMDQGRRHLPCVPHSSQVQRNSLR